MHLHSAMKRADLPHCKNRCGRRVRTMRSKLCRSCFKKKAAASGAESAGNAEAKGKPRNAGNKRKGIIKKAAGKRSGLKRSARVALVAKKQWVDKILAGEKDWEIRGCATARRGWIHFAESKAGGTLVGRARLVDCIRVPKAMFKSHVRRHCVTNVSDVPYKSIFAWVFEDAERFAKPFAYKHSPGAVIWVKV